MRRLVIALGAGLCLASAGASLSGCGTQGGAVRLAPSAGVGWSDAVREHTRRHEVYRGVMREADLRATLVTPRLRAVFIDHRSDFQGRVADDLAMEFVALGKRPDEGVDAPMKSGPDAESQVLILAAFFVADQKHKDLASSSTIWSTELVRGKARSRPLEIEPFAYDPAIKELFPHMDRFDQIYLLRFPLVHVASGQPHFSPGGEPLRLEVKSAMAEAAVEWSLQP